MAEPKVKKQRNYLLDLLKLFFALGAVLAGHYAETVGIIFYDIPAFDTSLLKQDGGYQFTTPSRILCWGAMSIAVFTFLTGYWMINRFKRDQKKGILGRGKDFSVVGKYFWSNYASYWPLAFVGTVFAILVAYITIPGLRFLSKGFIDNVVLAIPRLIGLKGFGMFPTGTFTYNMWTWAELTDNFTNTAVEYIFGWNQPLWYMFAIIAILPVIYFVFTKNETFGLFVFTPLMFTAGNVALANPVWVAASNLSNLGIDFDIFRLCGPMSLGIWGWYIVDYLKRCEFSKVGQTVYNIFSVVAFVIAMYCVVEGTGGFHMTDVMTAIIACFTLAEKDAFTVGFNKILNKLPFASVLGTCAAGIYLLHFPILQTLAYVGTQPDLYPGLQAFIRNFSVQQFAAIFLVFMFVLMIPYYFVDKYIIKGLTKTVGRVTKCNEPVVFNEPVAVEAEK